MKATKKAKKVTSMKATSMKATSMKATKKATKKATSMKATKVPLPELEWTPFVFESSLEDGPTDERDDLLKRMSSAIFKYHTRPRISGREEISLAGWMLDSGICLSLRNPPDPNEPMPGV